MSWNKYDHRYDYREYWCGECQKEVWDEDDDITDDHRHSECGGELDEPEARWY